MNVNVYTLGCRLNALESEAIIESFRNASFDISSSPDADLFIVNACTVTSKAEQKARRMIRLFSKKGICIITGCYAEVETNKLISSFKDAIVVKNSDKQKLLELPEFLKNKPLDREFIKNFLCSDTDPELNKFSFFAKDFEYHSRALIKVQDGCDRHCAFCRTSIARGKPESLNPDEVLKRINILQDRGYKDITLTGVNLALYNHNGFKLSNLIEFLLPHIRDGVYIRLSSLEPDLISDELINALRSEKIAPYFHIPIQSANKKVLEMSGRMYDKDKLSRIVDSLRNVKDDPFISCDVIAGLPGEGEREFLESYEFLSNKKLSYLHVFPFSARSGTRYENIPHPPEAIRDRRASELRLLSNELYKFYAGKFIKKPLLCTCENYSDGMQFFTSLNYIKFKKKAKRDEYKKGSCVSVSFDDFDDLIL